MASAAILRSGLRGAGARLWGWLQRYWLAVLLPPAVFLLGAGVTRQCFRAWDAYYYSAWRTKLQASYEAGKAGDRVKALQKLKEAARQAPDDPAAYRQLATGYQILGRTDLAVEAMERSFRLMGPQPNDEGMWVGFLRSYCQMKRYGDAERVLREHVLPRWPDSSEAYLYEGEIYLNREGEGDHLARAMTSLEKSLSLDPKKVQARYLHGVCLARLGRLAEAERAFEEVVQADPDHRTVYHDLAGVLRQQGKRDEAQRAIARFQKLQENQARITHLRTLIAFEKIQPREMLELGALYLEVKLPAEAVPNLLQYTKKEPTDPEGYRKLAEAYHRLERLEDAQAAEKLAAALVAARGGPR
jgi:predicted Zn-dependent protease